jgi:Zn-dependent protease with chaperone function
MRLSIRLAAMLRGITFIGDVGGVLLRSSSHRRRYRSNKDDNQGALVALGLGLYLVGLLGGLMAGLIKSAISKQKEYLADASAVQFTRNPEGIGDALKVIGGYDSGTLVEAGRAEEMSHLFFWAGTASPLEWFCNASTD